MGFFRLALSLIILQAHATPQGDHYVWANVSVLIFYALSGYGCTAAMQDRYQGKPWLFLANRYLRLWPVYAVVFGLSCWLMLWVAVPGGTIPRGETWWLNLLMLRSDAVPVAWVLPYMLLGYVAIAFGASATASRAAWWLVISFAWAQHRALLLGWGDYYGSLGAWSLAYSVGAVAYWLGIEAPRDNGWGKVASEISFPIFLTHFAVLAILPIPQGWPLFFAALGPTLALSWALVVAVERPVSKFRKS